ncbi:MAG TPA: alginate lyase family protein, partial [Pyrinomonadaceae bacterium]|nr:alginate lyase family protein [Pyrinomonadaceae bacterium]
MNLRKLKNASLDELRVRAAQRVAAFSERHGWSRLAKLPTDRELDGLVSLNGRVEAKFFASFESPEKTVAAFRSRWPDTAQRLVEKADRICEGRFDLLGLKNLSFGDPIVWQLEPTTNKRTPLVHWSKLDYLDAEVAGDKKIIWELNRHQYFATLGQAYWLTADERYARVFAAHLEAWMEENPPKLGINWASSLEVAFRSMSWLWAFYFFKSSPSLTPELLKRARKFLYVSARHLESYLSTYFSPNTHLTGEALGLFFLGTMLPEFRDAKRWQTLGRQILIEQLPVHVKNDGVYFEQSSYYHRYTTDFYLHFLLLSRANNLDVPPEVEKYLVLLLDHLMYITRPDGTTPLFGDDDGGRLAMLDVRAANDFRGTLAAGAFMFNRGDYKFVAGDAAEELLWLTGAEGLSKFDSIVATQPAETSKDFPEGGYFVMRDGWSTQANYMLFDCGPHGALNCGHAHADALSFDVAASGRTILVDPGTYTYTGSKSLRDWFRSSQAHNTVSIDNQSSSVPKDAFSWSTIANCSLRKWVSNDKFDFVSGWHDGYARLPDPATLARSILFIKQGYWIVRDVVRSTKEHAIAVCFHLDSRADSASLDIKCFGGAGIWTEEEISVSHCYGEREESRSRKFSARLADGDIVTFLLPKT